MNDHDLLIRIDQSLRDLFPRFEILEKKVDSLRLWRARVLGISCGAAAVITVIVNWIIKVL